MADVPIIPDPIVTPTPRKYTVQEFATALEKLCVEMGFTIDSTPTLFQQDNGSFSIKVVHRFIPSNK